MRGEIDAVHELSPSAAEFMEAEGQSTVHTFPFIAPYYIHLVFNQRTPFSRTLPFAARSATPSIDRR